MINSDFRKKMADSWFSYLQIQICKEFEFLENGTKKFVRRDWNKKNKNEGGGTSFLLSGGNVFEKVGVNKSTVSGKFLKKFRPKVLGASKSGKYWASGVSVVAHMKNPKIPAMHFNTRFIATTKEWFGGGMDATPSYQDSKERKLVHSMLKKVCVKNKKNYKRYKKWCDEYFYLPHRKEARGIAGIFDVASYYGLKKLDKEDYGQTLGTWGVKEGCYFVLPVLGPTTVRDSLGSMVNFSGGDVWYNVTIGNDTQYFQNSDYYYSRLTAGVDFRAKNLDAFDSLEKNSMDLYASVRSLYLQDRKRKIQNLNETTETLNDDDWEEIDSQ